jgi:hypothetical protein
MLEHQRIVRSRGAGGGGYDRRPTGPTHDLLRLQSAVGSAAMGRLVRGRQRSLARFTEAEHKALGDIALDARWRLPGSLMFKELQLTFGDWVSLGDWFEDINEIKQLLRPNANRDTVGQVYYALLVKIRPTTDADSAKAEKQYKDVLFNQHDKEEAEKRFKRLATANIKHFPNPLVGDTALSTAEKAKRRKDGKPLGAIAEYHADHLDAVNLAISAAQLGDERYLGEALAMDGFACHFLTDSFSGSHTRTPRSSIKTYWDAKVPGFDEKLVNWLTDEIAFVVDTRPSGVEEWFGSILDVPFHVVRDKARTQVRDALPPLSFGDIVSLVVHDWEGSHGVDGHGPLVEIAGQRFRTVGDSRLFAAVKSLGKAISDRELNAVLRNPRRSSAERTFAAAELAVRRSVSDVQRAYDLAKKGRKRSDILRALQGKNGLFSSELLISTAVPDAKQPEDERMPKWDYPTRDKLFADPKIHSTLPYSATKVAEPFEDTLKTLNASAAVKDHLRRMVITPLTSGSQAVIIAWVENVLAYRPGDLTRRLTEARAAQSGVPLTGAGLRHEIH